MPTKQDVLKVVSEVQHPAIAYSLIELGIVKDLEVNENVASVTFAFPFLNIPIADQLINSISEPIVSLGLDFQYSIVVMTEEEKKKFLSMEMKAWRG